MLNIKDTTLYRFFRHLCHDFRCWYFEWIYRFLFVCSRSPGITQEKRDPQLIVSLTSIPERITKVHLCLTTLLRQSFKPDRLILWLSESNAPDKISMNRDNLPNALKSLAERGLEIRWCQDIGSYRKIIPTLKAHPMDLIVTVDDDIFYPRHWLDTLYRAYKNQPIYIHCHRAHLIKFDNEGKLMPYRKWNLESPGYQGPSMLLFPTGVGGVLYAPGHLHSEVLNEEAFLKLCPKADDVWLKAMSILNNVECKKVSKMSFSLVPIRITGDRALSSMNFLQGMNDPQIHAVCKRYPKIARILKNR